ncbi:hypothetical protein ACFL2T_06380 [Elusimicrobiota bacterium]
MDTVEEAKSKLRKVCGLSPHEPTGLPFDTASSHKTYVRFYRVVREHLPYEDRLRLNQERETCGLPTPYFKEDENPPSIGKDGQST